MIPACNFAPIPLKGYNDYKLNKYKRFMKRLWIFAIALTISAMAFAQQGGTAREVLIFLDVKGKTLTVATTTDNEYEAYRLGGRNRT